LPELTIDQLPTYEQISHPQIRDAAAALSAARAAYEEARKTVTEFEQTREAAEWRDAQKSEAARAAGEKEPRRTEVAAHDRKTDDARHELKVAKLATERAAEAVETALATSGDDWLADLAKQAEAGLVEWQKQVNGLITLHRDLSGLLAVQRKLGVRTPNVDVCGFQKAQIGGLEFQPQQHGRKGWVSTPDNLTVLHDLATTEPAPPDPDEGETHEERQARHAEWDAAHAR
jgi:hypothetical protein